MPLHLIINGPPSSGKGTLCERLVKATNVVHISAGDALREEVAKDTPIGRRAKATMASGALVDDETVITIVLQRLRRPDVVERGSLLDGFPRTSAQAVALAESGYRPTAVVVIEVSKASIITRATGRRLDPQTGKTYHVVFNPPPSDVSGRLIIRDDDTAPKVEKRLTTFFTQQSPLIEFYGKRCPIVRLDGEKAINEVFLECQVALTKLPRSQL